MDESLLSWGRYPRIAQRALVLSDRHAPFPSFEGTALPRGNGRSYGDSCLADSGLLLDTRGLDRFVAFDRATGVVRCEAGVLLADLLALALPHGWFLPATPGTRFVTVGGAIANDVHGKNHHRLGSFGHHVRGFELLRSDGSRHHVTPGDELFAATIGGLGLTGLIVTAELALKRVAGPWIAARTERFATLRDFFELSDEAGADHEYTVAWVDCVATGGRFGRGVFHAGNHAPALATTPRLPRRRRLGVPFTPPVSPLNAATLRGFNAAYFHAAPKRRTHAVTHYEPFFYPLDAISNWNRGYGRAGFVQYQCVVPPAAREESIGSLLRTVAGRGDGSLLAVLKNFGDLPSPGLLSFPRAGTTLALDFPFRGARTLELLDRLDAIVADAGGAVYPGKDARMSAATFRRGFPAYERFAAFVDPKLRSRFWQRVHP